MTSEHDSSERDPELDRVWRAHSNETPPPALDRAILAAAHRAVGAVPGEANSTTAEATRPQRWWMPLAAAATIGVVAFGILQTAPQEDVDVVQLERVAPESPSGAVAGSGEQQANATPPRERAAESDAVKDVPGSREEHAPASLPAQKRDAQDARRAAPTPERSTQRDTPAASPRPPASTTLAQKRASPQTQSGAAERQRQETAIVKPRRESLAAIAPQPFPAAPAAGKPESTQVDPRGRRGEPALLPAPPHPQASADARLKSAPNADVARTDARSEERQNAAVAGGPATRSTSPEPAAAAAIAPPTGGDAALPPPPPAAGRSGPALADGSAPPARTRDAESARGDLRRQLSSPAPSPLAKTAATPGELRAKAAQPDAWITRIQKLRDEGNDAEALRELREFVRLVPNAEQRIPTELREWMTTAKP